MSDQNDIIIMRPTYTLLPHTMFPSEEDQTRVLRQRIEFEVLLRLKQLLADKLIDIVRMRAIAKYTLELVRLDASLNDLFTAVRQLGKNYTELAPVVSTVLKEYDTQAQATLSQMQQLIRSGDFDAAIRTGDKVINFQVN